MGNCETSLQFWLQQGKNPAVDTYIFGWDWENEKQRVLEQFHQG